jgi:hypothetical protein
VRIEGIDGLTSAELVAEINRGGRFVFFEYCISLLIFTLRRATPVVFLRADETGWLRGLPYSLLSVLLGWWGLPWGFIYTPLCLANNLAGGTDVTSEACESLGIPVKEMGPWVDG